jgi:hypothetical protein
MNTIQYFNNVEIMVKEQMKDVQREADQVRLLHDAGLCKPTLYDRTAVAFGNALVNLGQRLQRKYAHQAYRAAGGKYAV